MCDAASMLPRPISLLREALSNLAAEPAEQQRWLDGSAVKDELALDFANAYEALSSLDEPDTLDGGTMNELQALYDQLSVAADDPLWEEGLASRRWSSIRCLARRTMTQV
ncbi:hypothetical protein D1871_04730 [Nakamurella silvestris]|nr:hypothetical protein D1871_04730 [Nakamurella silvestris]